MASNCEENDAALHSGSVVQEPRGEAESNEAYVERTEAYVQRVLAGTSDFEARWQDFQQRFQDLTELVGQKMGLETNTSRPRPAAMITPEVAAQVLHRSSRVVVLTGAGISAESGIPTFRGADGFWTVGSENYRPQELATWEKYNEMAQELWRWYQYRWGICRKATPNAGHKALVELDSLVPGGVLLVTQNIDGLHRDAGSDEARLCEIHGRIDQMRCDDRVEGACLHGVDWDDPANFERIQSTLERTPEPAEDEESERVPSCARCGVRQRPKILWFDESYNEAIYRSKTVIAATEACDALLIIGTQLTTGLPNRMVQLARNSGALIIRIDPLVDLAQPSSTGMLHIQATSGESLPAIIAELRACQQEPLLPPLSTQPQPQQPTQQRSIAATRNRVVASGPRNSIRPRSKSAASRPAVRSSSPANQNRSLRAAASVVLSGPGGPAERSRQSRRQPTAGGSPARGASGSPAHGASGTLRQAEQVCAFFVYGTLRPDDDSGKPWTESFCANLHAQAAMLKGASLYIVGGDGFPSLCLEETRCSVRGVLLSVDFHAEGGQDLWLAKLAEADQIEGYPSLYDRTQVIVQTLNATSHAAYVYHRSGRFDREAALRLADGDWMSRKR